MRNQYKGMSRRDFLAISATALASFGFIPKRKPVKPTSCNITIDDQPAEKFYSGLNLFLARNGTFLPKKNNEPPTFGYSYKNAKVFIGYTTHDGNPTHGLRVDIVSDPSKLEIITNDLLSEINKIRGN